jgi:hypothetical protein
MKEPWQQPISGCAVGGVLLYCAIKRTFERFPIATLLSLCPRALLRRQRVMIMEQSATIVAKGRTLALEHTQPLTNCQRFIR